jgi:nicotinamidase-related amidase
LVIDIQAGVVAGAHDEARVLGTVGRIVDAARRQGAPIVWVQHEDGDLVRDTEAWRWAGDLAPAAEEPVVAKSFRDAFTETTLAPHLDALAARHLVIVGAQSEYCVRTTAHRAVLEGFDVTLVDDAHTTTDPAEDGLSARQIIAHTNDYFRGLRYPGRTVRVMPSTAIVEGLIR